MRLSVQLYTVRDHLSQDLPGTLSQIQEAGLKFVELAGDYGKSGSEWRALLDERGLTASGAHIGLDALEHRFDETVAFVKAVGFSLVIVPWIGSDAYANGWAAFGQRLEPIAQRLAEHGLSLAYHNHDFEYANGDGLSEMYANAPTMVAEVDAAWVKIGGHDPVAVVTGLGNRVKAVHGKDFDPTATPRWKPAGQGVMPLPELVQAAQQVGAEYLVIELDESPADPLDAVRESVTYYQSLGLN
ncbi:MAG: sugar phosphate isomerase/epimerase [Fimbriimonadaceae bacterium]|nr:sugar phosphate isomerase/epimerase [Fimbriimonadaceae bacterium]